MKNGWCKGTVQASSSLSLIIIGLTALGEPWPS